MKKLLALSGLALASTTVLAVEQPYLGVGYVQTTYENEKGGDADPGVAQIRFGTELSKHFGMRASLSVDAGSSTFKKSGVSYDMSVDSMYSLSAVARMPFGEHASIYGHVGYSYAQISFGDPTPATAGITAAEDNLDGLAFGAGIVLPAIRGFHVEVDYTSYLSGGDTLGGVGVGVRRYL